MKKTLFLPFAVVLVLFTSCNHQNDPPEPNNPPNGSTDPINLGDCGATASTDLIAGQHTVIGKVTASTDGTTLTVKYEIDQPNWGITQTHLSVKENWEDIPQAAGNPVPGQFEFKDDHDKIIGYTYHVDVSGLSQVSIAAHCKVVLLSGVNQNPIDGLVPGLNMQMDVDITSVLTGQSSGLNNYLGLHLTSGVGSGRYDGFCVDHGSSLSGHITYDVVSLDPFVTDASLLNCLGIDQPDNLDLVAYILNQYYRGAYPGADAEELQAAIWTLVEPIGSTITSTEIQWDQSIVNSILTDAQNGEGYIAGLCDFRLLLIDSKCSPSVIGGHDAQTVFTVIAPQECVVAGEETAWAFGPQFPGRNWGMYFNYCIQ